MSLIGSMIIVAGLSLGTAILAVQLIEVGARYRNRRMTLRVTKIIQSDKNPEIIGDGAWINTPASYPSPSQRIARIRDMQEPRGV